MGLNKKNKYANEVERRNGVKKQIKNEKLILFVYTTYLQVMFREKAYKNEEKQKILKQVFFLVKNNTIFLLSDIRNK